MSRRRGTHICYTRPARRGVCRVMVVGALALAAGGCMVGPDYATPETAVNDAWSGPGNGEAVHTRWWESFNDPTLNTLIEQAHAQNLTLRAAGLRVIEARARRGIAVGRFFPQLQQVTGGVSNNQFSYNTPAVGDHNYAQASVAFEAAWELDFWGKFRRDIEASDAELLRSVAAYDAVLVTLVADVAADYILIRSLEERLAYARANAQLQSDTLDLTNVRFKAGAVSELDVATARSTLANTQALIPEYEDDLRAAKLALCVLLGRTPSELDVELAGEAKVPEPPAQLALGIPAELLRRRPDVRAAERAAAAQSARIGVATADLYPSISIAGSTGFATSTFEGGSRSPGLGNLFDANSFAGFIGLQVNWPVFNYGRIEGNIRAQDALYEQAVAAYQESVLRGAAEVEAGVSRFLRSRERADFLDTAAQASARSVELSTIQYRAGAVDFIRLNDAQTKLVEAQDRLVDARAAVSLGAVLTYRALGGGWELRQGGEFVDEATAKRMRERTDWGEELAPGWDQEKDLGFKRPAESAPTQGTDQ